MDSLGSDDFYLSHTLKTYVDYLMTTRIIKGNQEGQFLAQLNVLPNDSGPWPLVNYRRALCILLQVRMCILLQVRMCILLQLRLSKSTEVEKIRIYLPCLYCKNEIEKSLYPPSLNKVLCIWYIIGVNFIIKTLLKLKKRVRCLISTFLSCFQSLLLKDNETKQVDILLILRRVITTLTDNALNKYTSQHELEYEDLNFEHSLFLIYIFHLLDLMYRKSIFLDLATSIVKVSLTFLDL
jgi:hypothetical protein